MHSCEVNSFPTPPGTHATHLLTYRHFLSLALSLLHTHTGEYCEPAVDRTGLGCTACRQILLWPLTGNWNRAGCCSSKSTCPFVSVWVVLVWMFAFFPPVKRWAKWFPKITVFPRWMFLLTRGLSGLLCSAWTSASAWLPQKRVKKEDPYCRSVCILPFGDRTGQWGDCTSWHYIVFWWMQALSKTHKHTDRALFSIQVMGFKCCIGTIGFSHSHL